jgi:putative aldouronate transport system permease protein
MILKNFHFNLFYKKLLLELQFLQQNYNDLPPGMAIEEIAAMPTETIRMAICVLVAGPILIVFPFFQKYFSKGLTVGSIKE